ncbi:MAG: PQQ-binding-like beta-propeller repeat protein [Methanomassiliicoccales archaeon]|nr:MAG: PQQ-binding-like beta-propeller repeat protein [Methanomassiliicoccales archaeon]
MNRFKSLAVVIVAGLIVGNLIILYQSQLTFNDEQGDGKTDLASDPILNRPTKAGSPWPMHLHDPGHTSYTTDSGPVSDQILWDNSTGGTTYGSPAVANGRVFIGGGNGMNAYYENNGTPAWRTPTYNPVPGDYGVTSSPAYSDGFVYFGGDGIYCLYENNGTVKWFVDTPWMNWGDGTPTVANGKVFIAGSDWNLYCIDQYSGDVIWTFQTSGSGENNWGLYAAPAVVGGLVYLSACDGWVYQINETQPSPIASANHSFRMLYASYSSPVVANGRVFMGCGYEDALRDTCRFYCLNATDLSLIWEFYPGSPTSFFSSGGFYNDRIYFGSRDGFLYCLDAMADLSPPAIHWQYYIGETWSSPAITNERLYIGSKANYLYCFNLSQPLTPNYYWRGNTFGDVDSSPAVSDGKVYVGTQGSGGGIFCFGSAEPSNPPPAPPTGLQANLASFGKNVSLSWNASLDDGGGDSDVAGYTVYKSITGPDGNYEFAAWIFADGSSTHDWIDENAGDGDPNDYFYIVRANDTLNNEEQNVNKVGKVVYDLAQGWNLISVPLVQSDVTRENVLQTVDGNYTALQGYHAGRSRPWLHWHKDKPANFNDVIEITHERGYYINMINPDNLVVAGKVQTNVQISLKTGWNLVGYPSLFIQTRDDALDSILGSFDWVEFYNTTMEREEPLEPNDLMYPGCGYWIHTTEDCELYI